MRTLLYARFSSHLQNSKSIADQVALLTARCEREGWQIVDIYTDHAISGAAGIDEGQRPGLAALLDRLSRRDIDQVFAESTDRLARHEGDAFTIRERIAFFGARLYTANDGEVDDIKGTIKGLFDSRFRKELGAKVKRGQHGTVSDGRAPAGKAYGYAIANRLTPDGKLLRGLRTIDPDQAVIVRRIFSEYAAGISPRAIAHRLNNQGITGPSGGHWRSSTIAGDRQRQNGMLQNELYRGVLVFNRTSKLRDPVTRKTLIKPNPESLWQRHDVPELRIISDDLWAAVQAKRQRYATHTPQDARRPKRPLSGLTVCGTCGGAWIVLNRNYTGCGSRKDGSTCDNSARVRIDRLEARVLGGLEEQLLQPELVSAFVAEFHRERATLLKAATRQRSGMESELKKVETQIARLVEAIMDPELDLAEVRDRLTAAKARQLELRQTLSAIEDPRVVTLHPNLAEDYRKRWANLRSAMATQEGLTEIVPHLRAMIDRITISPPAEPKGEAQIEIVGKLAEILGFATGKPIQDECTIAVERVRGIEPL
ncbi:recombinase family protein [Sphingorhabdus pulchriflava]|uniref:Recombinase family protein n=1 Tax=Sphingorhabdus pulchriflava TaxID=2292257 RepID=A0A371BGA8_9SPHN|nr:recombinase family protein [Sphingorhabdus pulchriflava]RDV06391.1 recombinase family protein [Sphingorhabdus pulchriflava]